MGRVEDRLYGIGASLDVGGMRFAAVLTIIVYLCLVPLEKVSISRMILYIMCFLIISVVGNMIGRSTTIGIVVSIFIAIGISLRNWRTSSNVTMFWRVFLILLVVFVPVLVVLYNVNPVIAGNIRFAFEGFFSLVEVGRWEVHSNEILRNMIVFPDNARTWFIGDGYIENPYHVDPYYTGPRTGGYYMGTDVGYLRFLFYFGICGTVAFISYMFVAAQICVRRFESSKILMYGVLAINYIIWFKVASDLYLLLALFLCVPADKEQQNAMITAEK